MTTRPPSSLSTTTTMTRGKPHVPVPLLLSSFPAPPSHIPPTPTSASPNPPPSGPPSAPLPPVPGPSRISEADTLQLFLLSSRVARDKDRSRRSSKYSVNSLNVSTHENGNNRDSMISLASVNSPSHSYHGHGYGMRDTAAVAAVATLRSSPPSTGSTSNRNSTASNRSNPRSASSMGRPTFGFSIEEEDSTRTPNSRPTVESPILGLGLSDDDEPNGLSASPTVTPSRRRRKARGHQANESISSIDMRDIMGAASGGEDDEAEGKPLQKPGGSPLPSPLSESKRHDSTIPSSHSYKSSLAYLKLDNLPSSVPQRPAHGHARSLSGGKGHHRHPSGSGSGSNSVIASSPTTPSPLKSSLTSSSMDVNADDAMDLASASTATIRSTSVVGIAQRARADERDRELEGVLDLGVGMGIGMGRSPRSVSGSTTASSVSAPAPKASSTSLDLTASSSASESKSTSTLTDATTKTISPFRTKPRAYTTTSASTPTSSLSSPPSVPLPPPPPPPSAPSAISKAGAAPPPTPRSVRKISASSAMSTMSTSTKSTSSTKHLEREQCSALRSPSPDIATILSYTPKPARLSLVRPLSQSTNGRNRKSGNDTGRSRVGSMQSVKGMRSVKSLKSDEGADVDVDEFGVVTNDSSTTPAPMKLSKSLGVSHARRRKGSGGGKPLSGGDTSLDYIVKGVWDHQNGYEEDETDERRLRALERTLEGCGSGSEFESGEGEGDASDDSSIDLHTPLPHLMVRHGLLSPNSKLLPQAESRAATPHGGVDGRPGSTMSVFSTATKSGVIKDERDTPMRRVRHRDGRLLKGGIGLTTGLGWSDSEDEDAPSPLTRRLSTLNLSRRSSASSFFASASGAGHGRPHPLSRSYSSGTLYEDASYGFGFDHNPDEEDEFLDEALNDSTGEWAHRQRRTVSSTNPPTAWQRKMSGSTAGNGSARTSVASSGGRLSVASSGGRMSIVSSAGRASVGSAFSLEVSIPEDDVKYTKRSSSSIARRRPTRVGSGSSGELVGNRRSGDDSMVYTPSTASTLSIPLPVTPQQDHQAPSQVLLSASVNGKKRYLDKDKSLPPLPGVLRKAPSKSNLATPSVADGKTAAVGKYSFPRARTFSSTSSSASTPSPPQAAQSMPAPNVRPLQLPRQVRSGDRPPVPVPSISSSNLRTPSLTQSRSYPGLAISPTSPDSASPPPPSPLHSAGESIAKPKPRTGTGMVYKSSGGLTKLKAPMQLHTNSAVSTPSSNGRSVSGIGRPGGVPRAIAI